MHQIKLREEYIKLGQALKAAGLAESGADAKNEILDGRVKVNGMVEYQRGKNFMMETLLNLMERKSKSLAKPTILKYIFY